MSRWELDDQDLAACRLASQPYSRKDREQALPARRHLGEELWLIGDEPLAWEVPDSVVHAFYEVETPGDTPRARERIWTYFLPMPCGFSLLHNKQTLNGGANDALAFGPGGQITVVQRSYVENDFRPYVVGPTTPRTFVSYARKDRIDNEEAFALIDMYLGGDRRNPNALGGFIDTRNINPGDRFDDSIADHLATVRTVIVLVGTGFLRATSDDSYARKIELPLAFHAQRQRGTGILPVLLEKKTRPTHPGLSVANDQGTLVKLLEIAAPVPSLGLPTSLDDELDDLLTTIVDEARKLDLKVQERIEAALQHVEAAREEYGEVARGGASAMSATGHEPPTSLPRPNCPWFAESNGETLRLVRARGDTIRLQRNGERHTSVNHAVHVRGERVSSMFAADDGSAALVSTERGLEVIDLRPIPTVWPMTFPTDGPSERPLGIRRVGRTYSVVLAADDSSREVTVDSGGAVWPTMGTPATGPALISAAGVEGSFVQVTDTNEPLGMDDLVTELHAGGLRHWTCVDGALAHTASGSQRVVAGVGTQRSGDEPLLVVAETTDQGTQRWSRELPAPAYSVAVARPASGEQVRWVVVEFADELWGWTLADLAEGEP